jgi:sugar phosphate isomerase/epimerase
MVSTMASYIQPSRRAFLSASLAAPLLTAAPQVRRIPIGLELFSVRDELAADLRGTVTAVAKQGYEVVEFYSPYFEWTPAYAREVRKLLDGLNIKCYSTHNGTNAFTGDGIAKAIELNRILGSRYVVMASAGDPRDLDGWKKIAELLTAGNEKFSAAGMHAGYHNHQAEFKQLEGKRPIEVLAANTPKDVVLQLDVGTCVEVKSDPVAWIKANPGRIKCLHLKDWGAREGYSVLFGEGDTPWKAVFAAAESAGGVEFYLIEQEGSRFPAIETAAKCLATYRKMRA